MHDMHSYSLVELLEPAHVAGVPGAFGMRSGAQRVIDGRGTKLLVPALLSKELSSSFALSLSFPYDSFSFLAGVDHSFISACTSLHAC